MAEAPGKRFVPRHLGPKIEYLPKRSYYHSLKNLEINYVQNHIFIYITKSKTKFIE